jgi:hypothetical protein
MKTNWLSKFLIKLTGSQMPGIGSGRAPADPDTVKQMVRGIVSTRSEEIGCEECFQQVDRFADRVLAGQDAADAMPLVQDHLDRCHDCREEFEALLEALKALS